MLEISSFVHYIDTVEAYFVLYFLGNKHIWVHGSSFVDIWQQFEIIKKVYFILNSEGTKVVMVSFIEISDVLSQNFVKLFIVSEESTILFCLFLLFLLLRSQRRSNHHVFNLFTKGPAILPLGLFLFFLLIFLIDLLLPFLPLTLLQQFRCWFPYPQLNFIQ